MCCRRQCCDATETNAYEQTIGFFFQAFPPAELSTKITATLQGSTDNSEKPSASSALMSLRSLNTGSRKDGLCAGLQSEQNR